MAPPSPEPRPARGYEMVSLADKEKVDISAGAGGGQVSASGDAIHYMAVGAFSGAPSAGIVSNYLARQDSTGWSTESIDPPLPSGGGGHIYYMFTDDLTKGGRPEHGERG
jgi:hypothetical protein